APELKFQRPVNMEVGTILNTVRLDSRGLEKGSTVNLVDAEGETFGHAYVLDVIKGPWARVAPLAGDNHAVKDRAPEAASAALKEELTGFYGDKITDDTEYDVIYLRRDK